MATAVAGLRNTAASQNGERREGGFRWDFKGNPNSMLKSVDVQQDRKGEGGLVCVGFNGGERGRSRGWRE